MVKEIIFLFPECFDDFKEDKMTCYAAANLGKYLKVPMLIIQSPYDDYTINVVVGADCLIN